MKDKLRKLYNKRNNLKEEQILLSEERKEFNELSKKFNKTVLIGLLTSIVLMIPMTLYTIPIIPTTCTIAGETIKAFKPILPATTSLNLLMYPAFLGGTGFIVSTSILTIGNMFYFLPLKIIGRKLENNIKKERKRTNKKIIEESNDNYDKKQIKSNYPQVPRKNNYSYRKKQLEYNGYQYNKSTEDIVRKAQERIKKRKLKKTSSIHNIDF